MPTPPESPDLRSRPYNRLKTLKNPIVPWATGFLRSDPFQQVPNQDAVLQYLAQKDEREYFRMERAEPTIAHCLARRRRRLLSQGWRLKPANAKPAAKELYDFGVRFLREIHNLPVALQRMHDAVFVGWRPMERTWSFDDTYKGRPAWYVEHLREKPPHLFRFTVNRSLVYVGDLQAGEQLFDFEKDVDRLRWLVCSAGSTDNPYGEAELGRVWMPFYMLGEFTRLWALGVQRSMGVIQVKEGGAAKMGTLASRDATIEGGGPGAGMTVKEIAKELQGVLEMMKTSGVLVQRFGYEVTMAADVTYADGWKDPLLECKKAICLALTGDVLSLTAGEVGSRAAMETTNDQLEQLVMADGMEIAGWINDQLLKDAFQLNFPDPDPDDVPRFEFRAGRKMDIEIAKLLISNGAVLDAREIAEEGGVPLLIDPQEGDVPLQKQQMVLGPDGKPVPVEPGAPGGGPPPKNKAGAPADSGKDGAPPN